MLLNDLCTCTGRHQHPGGTIQEYNKYLHKYGFDTLIILGSYGGHRQKRKVGLTKEKGQLPTAELN